MKYLIRFFEDKDGSYPVEDFILEQDEKMRAKISRNLELLEERGPSLREPYSKELSDGIFEVRTVVAHDATRILYFFVRGRKIILTNGFIKKSQKTPKREIEIAKNRRASYLLKED